MCYLSQEALFITNRRQTHIINEQFYKYRRAGTLFMHLVYMSYSSIGLLIPLIRDLMNLILDVLFLLIGETHIGRYMFIINREIVIHFPPVSLFHQDVPFILDRTVYNIIAPGTLFRYACNLCTLSILGTVLFNRPRRYLFFIMNSIQLYKDCYYSIGILYTYDREHIHLYVDTLFKL